MTNEVAKKKQLPAFLVLTIICLIAALALAATNAVTKGPIEEHAAAARAANFSSVLSATTYEEVKREGAKDGVVLVEAWNKGTLVDAVASATVTSDAVIKAVNAAVKAEDLTASAKGFQSDVTAVVTLDETGAIATLTVDSSAETMGLGTRCAEDEAFISQFIGKTAPFVRQEGRVGYCVSASAEGYGGAVAVTLGVNEKGEIVGAKIGDNNFRETDTIGGKWLAADKVEQFIGINLTDGGAIDTIAGATITSDAVKAAANKGADVLRAHLNIESDTPVFGEPKPIEYADSVAAGEYSVTADGFQSKVQVTFTVDENSTITALTMDTSGETPSYGTRCGEDEGFVNQFIGKTVPVTEFDVLSGASITSNAVVKAINSIAVAGAEEPAVETSAEETPVDTDASAGTAYEASAQGFQSEVKVTVYADKAGVITGIKVDASGETQGLGTRCGEDEAFLNQFIGKTAPVEADALSGATVTSNAVIEAVNAALTAPAAGEEKVGKAQGFQSEVTVTLTVDAGVITGIVVDSANETPGFGTRCGEDEAFLNQFIGKKATPDLGEGIDVLAGATVTSNAVIEAANAAIGVAVEVVIPAAEALTATVPAFDGENITVTVTLDEAGNVATLVVDAATQTAGLGQKCAEDEFVNQFIGAAGPFVLGENVDAVSYATITSQAVVDAVNSVLPAQEAPAVEEPAAEALTATVPAFDGENITVTVTLDEAGNVATLVVDAATQTPGLGQKCAEAEFVNQFIGAAGPFVLGENVDAVSYATITSQAVVDAVNSVLPTQEAPAVEEPAADALTATVPAFDGENITVTVTLDENGNVATLVVDAATQTPGLGQKCAEAEFVNQFIGAAGPFVLGENVDAVSYATITSQAVVDAVNSVLPTQDMSVTDEEVPAYDPAADLTATVPAFAGENITVTVTLDENGNVATLVVDASTQTPGLGQKCAEDEFVNQFIGAAGPFVLGENVDAVSYATITSQAVVDAVNSVLPAQEAPAVEEPAADALTATVPGYDGENITVTVTLDEAGNVATLVVDASTQTPGLGQKCAEAEFVNQFIGAAGPFVLGENVDAVSYATITSQAVVDAVNSVLPTQDMSVTDEEVPAYDPAADLTATVPAFDGENITVTVTLDEAGNVATLVVDASTQTPGLGQKCAEDEFVNQFIGAAGPFVLGENVDAVSYATITSQAVVDAVNQLLGK